ncbi:hypothetical protein [Acinetobacter calcoaceticus]|nr:hypothetical protein [Acinetobacter calcoaceticus]
MIHNIKNKFEDFLYNNKQIGLVFILLLIILLISPISVYGMIFFNPISQEEVNYYSKFGAWFTTLGAIFTVINTIVVIYLMIWLHRKETSISLLSQITELRENIVEIQYTISSEIEYFNVRQYDIYETLHEQKYQRGFHFYGHDELYEQEIINLNEITKKTEYLYANILSFKEQFNNFSRIDFINYQNKSKIISLINETIVLNKPSTEYKKSFIVGSREDAEPEDMIEVAKINSLKYIDKMLEILEKKAP